MSSNFNTDLKEILAKKFNNGNAGHFYILEPNTTEDINSLPQWTLDLIAKIMSSKEENKKPFDKESILNHEDFLFIDNKTSTNYKLQDFSSLFSFFNYQATRYDRKIVLIDDADKISVAVANKLLKTLEEPPIKATIFLLNTNKVALLDTIKSRGIKLRVSLAKTYEELSPVEGKSEISDLLEEIKQGKTLDEFILMYKSNKQKEVQMFKSLNDWVLHNCSNAKTIQLLEHINKQLTEDYIYHAPPLNRMHKTYNLLKELIDG